MTTTHLRRDKFDRDRNFVVAKKLSIRGTKFGPGDAFDKHLVTLRRLRQLYDSRFLAMGAASTSAPAAMDPDRMTDNQLSLFLEDNGLVPRYGASRVWLIRKVKEFLNAGAVAGSFSRAGDDAERPSPSAP